MAKKTGYTAHVSSQKKEVAHDLVKLFEEYPIVGAVDIENLPAAQFASMRAKFRKNMVIRVAKKRVMAVALEQASKKKAGLEKLTASLTGMPALIFTKENPFKLVKFLNMNKSPSHAKAGQKAPKEIIVPAGPTSFAPGPIIGQLGKLGIKAGIEGGKIVIKADSKVAKEGDVIGEELASVLTRLDIKPMEIGLNLVAAFENGEVFMKNVLQVDDAKVLADFQNGSRWAFNLAIFSAYPSKDTIKHLITKGARDSRGLCLVEGLPEKGIIKEVIGRAHMCASAVKNTANV